MQPEQQNNQIIKDFFDSFYIYKKVIDNNYMFHKEMYTGVADILKATFANHSFAILDLGCGDATYISNVLKDFLVSNYTGVDLSQIATSLAAKNLPQNIASVKFIHDDFINAIQNQIAKNQFDVVFTSYALHHYPKNKKEEFFQLAHSLLKPNGILIVVDVILEANQSVAEYCKGINAFYANDCNKLSQTEIVAIASHINESDIPETINTYSEMARSAQFSTFEPFSKEKFFQLFWCKK